jgi:hypothetical protein
LVQVSHPNVDPVPGVTVECSRISDSGKVVTKCRVYNPLGYWGDSQYCDNHYISELCYEHCKDDPSYEKAFSFLSEGIKNGFDGLGWDLDHYWINESPENLLAFKDVDFYNEPSNRQLEIFAMAVERIVLEHPELPRMAPNRALIYSVWTRLLHPFNVSLDIYNRWLYGAYKLGLVSIYYYEDARLDPDPFDHNGFIMDEKRFLFFRAVNPEKFNCIEVA